MQRGEIWWADLPEPHGGESGYRRPVLLVQSDYFTFAGTSTVLAVPLTANLNRAFLPGSVLLEPQESGLSRNSVVNVLQLLAVDRRFLLERVGAVTHATLSKIDDRLRLVLSL